MYLLWMICVFWHANTSAESVMSMYMVDEAPTYFNYFMSKFNKEYADEQARVTASEKFKNNLKFLNQLNQESEDAVYGINKYMDITADEFIDRVKCITGNLSSDNSMCRVMYDSDIIEENAPKAFDWRTRSVVTSVKDQGNCRSCYAFAAIGQIEAQNAIMNERFTELSIQQIVDCDNRSQKCKGGYMAAAFRSLIEQGGVMRNEDYPYIEKSRRCRTDAERAAVKVVRCATYKLTSQEKLKQLLYNTGPIAVGIVSADGILFYQRGVIMDSQCKGNDINHAVLLVGYGVEKGIPYWTCKNSLGVNWGEGGYFRIQRGEKAHSCGILNEYMATASIEIGDQITA